MRKLGFIGGCLVLAASLVWPLQGAAAAQSDKLVVITMENETYDNIVGSSEAPYLNGLIPQGELFTDYAAVASGSNPNYLGMTSGLTSALSPPSPNIFQAIDGSGGGFTWKEFMESMQANCAGGTRPVVPGTTVPLYTSDHDPGYAYRANTTCSTNDVPMTADTFVPASLPSLSYIVPNECDDMHTLPANGQDCPAYFGSNSGTSLINMGDNWLASVVPSLLAQPNVTVLITWDEGTQSSTPPQHIVTLEVGAGVTAGSRDDNAYTHYGLEAGLYRYFGLGTAPNNGASAAPLALPSRGSAPAAPASFAAVPAAAAVSLSWTDSDATSTYQLQRSSDPGFGSYTSVSLPAGAASYNDTGLPSAVFYYRLAAVSSGGQSPYVSANAATISYDALVAGRAGLLGRWRLGETSGAAAKDTTGSYDGSYVNGPALGSPGAIAADPNTSVTFNGTNQRVSVPSLPPAGDFSIEGWTYLTNGSVNNNTLYGGGTVRLLARPGTGSTAAYAGVTLNGSEYVLQPVNPAPNLNTWVYWVLTRQGGTLTLYRDGGRIGQRADLPATAAANISGYIADQANGLYYLNGRVQDVAVYTRALSNVDVSNGYAAALNGVAPSSASGSGSYYRLVTAAQTLLAYWRLGETSGTAATDVTSTFNGSYVNGPALGSPGAIAADPNTSVTFNGTNQRVSVPSLPPAGDFSIEGWTYLTNGSVNNNTLYGGGGTVRLLARPGTGWTAAYAGVTLNGSEYVLQPVNPAPNLNTWVYWVLTRQGGTLTLYRDGVRIGQRADLPATAAANISGYIADQANGLYYLNGRVQDVAVYTRALSNVDVSNGYAAALNGVAPSSASGSGSYYRLVTAAQTLLAYWRLGERWGTAANDVTSTFNGSYVNGPALGSPGAIAADPNTSVTFNGTNQRVSVPSLPP